MNKILMASAAVVGLGTGVAAAADLPVYGPGVLQPPPFTWTGFYIGINGGGASSDNTASYAQTVTPGFANASFSNTSWTVGAQAGFNWQIGYVVAGVEGDLEGRHWTGSATSAPLAGDAIDLVTLSQTERWLGTARGRVGIAFGDALLYATAGGASGEVEHSFTEFRITTGQTRILGETPTKVGWVAGGGLDYRIWHNVAVGVEYLHVDFGRTTLINPASTVGGLAFQTSQATFTDRADIVRARLNWLFGSASY